jgi:hypothetical protein
LPTAGNLREDTTHSELTALGGTSVSGSNPSIANKTGITDGNAISSSGIIQEDLYGATAAAGSAGAYTYEGVVTFNYGNNTLTFDPATESVPEPSTYALLAGGGLVLALLRNKLTRKSA